MGGGMCRAISAIAPSGMTPGPLGIAETSPSADAPQAMAARASSREAMQQIFTRGVDLTGDALGRLTRHKVSCGQEGAQPQTRTGLNRHRR